MQAKNIFFSRTNDSVSCGYHVKSELSTWHR